MAFEFPEFQEPIRLDARRSWTASYESYDQRNEDVYYLVTVTDGGESSRFMVQVGLYWAGDDWTGPEFLDGVRSRIHDVAMTGKANTSYTGPMGFHRT